jgi:hypothetical protein
MRLAEIRDRLTTECPALKEVLSALSGSVPKSYPSAYLIPLTEAGDPSLTWPVTEQRMRARFAVEIMVKSVAQAATGGPAQEDLEDLRDAVKVALRGFSPTYCTPIEFASGRLMDFNAGLAAWRDEYTTEYYERSS